MIAMVFVTTSMNYTFPTIYGKQILPVLENHLNCMHFTNSSVSIFTSH